MKIDQVAVITYTIRDFIKTPEDFRKSMKKVADIGYRAVQISGMDHAVMPAEEVAAVCKDNGLTICATHEKGEWILTEPERVVERLDILGCRYTAYPYPSGIDLSDASQVADLIAKLNHAGSVLRQSGKVLAYHNHALEFFKGQDQRTILRRIYDETDAHNLQGEIDTYWVQLGGENPIEWCEFLKGRLPLLHIKDVGITDDRLPTMVEIGNGNLNFKKIIAAAEQSGCEWFIVEQDRCPGDPFDSIAASFNYIKNNLVD
jgi:sugar phosphate isomerase/epimerase